MRTWRMSLSLHAYPVYVRRGVLPSRVCVGRAEGGVEALVTIAMPWERQARAERGSGASQGRRPEIHLRWAFLRYYAVADSDLPGL